MKDFVPYIIAALILSSLIIIPMVLVFTEGSQATKNCKSNGWDTAGSVGAIIDRNFECYNYTKSKRDALQEKAE